jgi:aminoglycoside phosphotransferase (APT) family kinase protein
VYRLETSPVVVKIARPSKSVRPVNATLAIVRTLAALDFPVVPIADEIEQPRQVGGSWVTFWRHLPQLPGRPIRAGDIGEPLRRLHNLPTLGPTLPRLDALAAISNSLRASSILDRGERRFLDERCESLAESYSRLVQDLPVRLIHGDPQHRNTLWNDQHPVLADWESAVIGPIEWDLITIEIHCRRFGYHQDEYRAFVAAYGRDIRYWSGYSVMRNVREIRMIASNARKSAWASPAAEEVHRRIADLRSGRSEERWNLL